jgi:hypothetical protein
MATLELFLDINFKDEYVQKKVNILTKALEKNEELLQSSPENSDEHQKAVELKKYYEIRIFLENKLADTRLNLLKYLLTKVINLKGQTPELEEFTEYINSILNRVTFAFEKEWEYVFQIEEHYWIVGDNKFDETQISLKKYLDENSKEPNPFDRLKPKFILL